MTSHSPLGALPLIQPLAIVSQPTSIDVPGEGTGFETMAALGMAVFLGAQAWLLYEAGKENWDADNRILGAVGYAGAITSIVAAGSGVVSTFLRRST